MKRVIDRIELKGRAKAVLKRCYWLLFVVSLIMMLLSGGGGSSSSSSSRVDAFDVVNYNVITRGLESIGWSGVFNNDIVIVEDFAFNDGNFIRFSDRSYGSNDIGRFIRGIASFVIAGLAIVGSLFGALLYFFIVYPLNVGGNKIFLNASYEWKKPSFSDFAHAFGSGKYMNIVCAGFLTTIYTVLWTLLFIIPGIVKSYAYSMVPYILAENPEMSASDAIRLSNAMTHGHKGDMFVLDLSFIGWYLLGAIAFGLGGFFVRPYHEATKSQLYLALRDNAIREELAVPEHFGYVSEDLASAASKATPNEALDPQRPPKPGAGTESVVDYRDKPYEN